MVASSRAYGDLPHGEYRLVVDKRTTTLYDHGRPMPSCGKRATSYLEKHDSFRVIYDGALSVDGEEWILLLGEPTGETDPREPRDDGRRVGALRRRRPTELRVVLVFGRVDDRAFGIVSLEGYEGGKRCADGRFLTGRYAPEP
jgi:hypothetical protein